MIGTSKGRKSAIGFRAHSGWACAVLVAGTKPDIEVLDRRRVELCDPSIDGSKQPFHAAEPMPFDEARTFIARCTASTAKLSGSAAEAMIAAARAQDLKPGIACVLAGSGRALPDVKSILASHALIHAAEGEFYRDALVAACGAAGLNVVRLKEKDATVWAASRLGLSESALSARIVALGAPLGPPWGQDQKLATMGAWLALAG